MKMGMCSVITCSEKAVKEIRFSTGAVGGYCDRHYAERIKARDNYGVLRQAGTGVVVSIPLTADEQERFERYVGERGMKKGAFVRFAILRYLDAKELDGTG